MPRLRPLSAALALGGLLAALPSVAGAWEADAVLESMQGVFEEQGFDITWGDAAVDGTTIRLSDAQVALAGEAERLPIGSLTLNGVSEQDDSYRVDQLSLPYYSTSAPDGSLTATGVSISGLVLPKQGTEAPYGGMMVYDSIELGEVVASMQGTQIFRLTDLHAEMMVPEGDDGMLEFTGAAEGFALNLDALVEEDAQRQVLQRFGYSELKGYLEMAGSWRPSDGRLIVSQYDLTVVDAGTIGLMLDLSGYTPAFIDSMRQVQEQMAANPEGESAQGLAMLGLLQQLNFHGAVVRFSDDTLTNKVLEFVAAQQGAEPSDVANQVKAIVPMQLMSYLGPELTTEVSEAVTRFLDNPESLEIRAEPDKPVPFALLMGAAMASPQSLPGQIGLAVNANE